LSGAPQLRLRLQSFRERAYALGIDAEIGAAVAALGADVDATPTALGLDAHHDVVVEAEPLGAVDRLDAALGRRARHDVPAHRHCHTVDFLERLGRRHAEHYRLDVGIAGTLLAGHTVAA